MKQLNNQKGFTLIELIMVITILGILAVAAAPSFIDLTSQATSATVSGVAAAVQDGINMTYAQNAANGSAAFPTSLGSETDGNTCDTTGCFGSVLQQPITDANWTRTNATTYSYSDGTNSYSCTYNTTTGVFTCS